MGANVHDRRCSGSQMDGCMECSIPGGPGNTTFGDLGISVARIGDFIWRNETVGGVHVTVSLLGLDDSSGVPAQHPHSPVPKSVV